MDAGFGIGGFSKSYTEMTTSKLDYWTPFIMENGVKQSFELELRPHSNTINGPYEFSLQADSRKFIDMSTLTLHARMGVRVEDAKLGSVIPSKIAELKKTDWGLINNFYQSLFSSIIIKINDTEIGDLSYNSYPYMSYLQTLLGTSSSHGTNHILPQRGFIKDRKGHVAIPESENEDSPYSIRKNIFHYKDFSDFCIPVHNDLCTMEKYLPPNVKIGFTIRRTNDDFVFWNHNTANKYKFKIVLEDIHLKVKVMELYEPVLQNHFKQVKSSNQLNIKYTKNVMKTFTVPTGSVELKQHNLFFGNCLPNRVYLAFVEQEAFNGSLGKNPFYFERADMREACLVVNSLNEPSPPYRFTPGEHEKELYFALLENTGTSSFDNEGINVSFDEFMHGYFVLAFDRSPLKDNGLYNHKPDVGQITINVKCQNPVSKNYMVICYASYDSKLVFIEDKVISQSIY